MYPTWLPTNAAIASAATTSAIDGRCGRPFGFEDRKPARKNSESPGRKKPINSPVSAKMISEARARPPLSSHCSMLKSASTRLCGDQLLAGLTIDADLRLEKITAAIKMALAPAAIL